MCHTSPVDFLDGRPWRLGQARSPYTVEFNKNFERVDRKIPFSIDGETYELRNVRKLTFKLDEDCLKLKILRREQTSIFETGEQILTELKQSFQTGIL